MSGPRAVPLAETTGPDYALARELLAAEEAFSPLDCQVLVVPSPVGPERTWDRHFRGAFAGQGHADVLSAAARRCWDGRMAGRCLHGVPWEKAGEPCVLLFPEGNEAWRLEDPPGKTRRTMRRNLAWWARQPRGEAFARQMAEASEWALAEPRLPSLSDYATRNPRGRAAAVAIHELGHRRVSQALGPESCSRGVGALMLQRLWGTGLRPPTLYAACGAGEWVAEAYALWHARRLDDGNAEVVEELRACISEGRRWLP